MAPQPSEQLRISICCKAEEFEIGKDALWSNPGESTTFLTRPNI